MIQPTVFDVRRYLEEYLETGDLGPGGRLPTERELSERTGASRRLIRRVLAALEAEQEAHGKSQASELQELILI